ncbi:hypothetical protein OSCT_1239 [Oscillochloris trichoides DG-6]|uniref:Flavinylation-associated cytochrome domain-containing protein n=1 Tax=Oscillochloris trichoides DG-6 TaxID=765420 RepID=E1ID38_9CHLR|nr:DUF4405 domain-containing protein [Oscillochloris trichoides]EFO80909.1 hypothetical protein OSCT_1239 [Oscillochloris trichoides DG-6]
MKSPKRQPITARANLLIDLLIFVGFLLATAPRFTGIAIHEWLGIAFGAAIITHLLIHWQWIIAVGKKLFSRAHAPARLNYILNLLLFIDVTLITFTGIMISEVVLPLFGLRLAHAPIWTRLHSLTSDAGVILIGLHIALHWSWIVKTATRLFTSFLPKPKAHAEMNTQEVAQ